MANLAIADADREDADAITFIRGGISKRVHRKEFASKCAFQVFATAGQAEEDRMLDQLVMGTREANVRQKLLALPNDATLTQAYELARTEDAASRDQHTLANGVGPTKGTLNRFVTSYQRQKSNEAAVAGEGMPTSSQGTSGRPFTCGSCCHREGRRCPELTAKIEKNRASACASKYF